MPRRRPVLTAHFLPAALALFAILVPAGCARRAPRAVTFGVVSDCQFAAVPPSGTRFYDRSWLKLRQALDLFNARGVRFVAHLGDLIDREAASYDLILPVFAHSRVPVRFVIGNHDYDIAADRKAGLLDRLGLVPGYSAFSEGDWRFVILNGDELGVNFPKDEGLARESDALFAALEAAGRPNATKWNGGVGRAQLAFLERELAAADRDGLRAVVLCHFPVHPPAGHNLWNDEEVVALLERHPCVKAYLSGHNHEGGLAVRNGIAYLTFAGMVESAGTTAAAIVTLTEGRLTVEGIGREPSRAVPLR